MKHNHCVESRAKQDWCITSELTYLCLNQLMVFLITVIDQSGISIQLKYIHIIYA